MATAAIRTEGLTKRFGRQLAVSDVDLEVPAGSVYGFLGPNGSGKTTTIRMLLGLIRPAAGSAELLGQPIPAAARDVLPRVGALVEGPAFHPYLSGQQNLARLDAADAGVDRRTARARIAAALDRVGLTKAAGKRYRSYSLGMRQRLGIAAALLQPRELLILDEPTNGLDPQGTREVRHLISDLAGDGTTILVSSHLLGEVEQICSHVGVMNQGSLLMQGSTDELRSRSAPTVRLRTADAEPAIEILSRLGVQDPVASRDGDQQLVVGLLGQAEVPAIVPALVAENVSVLGFTVAGSSLEDAFVQLTGEGFDVSG